MGSLRELPPTDEVHVWRADLDARGARRAGATDLPAAERARAARILPSARRRRWIASRRALREVLAAYLGEDPGEVELATGWRGKPRLAGDAPLRFSLSHSDGVALIAVASEREVGVDLERVGRRRSARRRPPSYYEAWVRREAAAKCFGGGLGEPPPDRPLVLLPLDAGEGWAAALAVAGTAEPLVRRFELVPAPAPQPAATA